MPTRLIQLGALLLTVAGLVVASLLTPTINAQRVERQFTYDVEVGDSDNPAYVLGSALGSFRGVLIHAAWQRSESLKQEGKFFESNNLAEWIVTMQPRFVDAWDIQAWNMAYNISVKCKTAEERWDWVNKGITLLRDRGIPNNPNGVVLYRSIAWILGHKVAGQTDDFHWYYKARMAENWQTLLGAPDPGWDWKPEYQDPANRPLEEEFDALTHGEWLATRQFAAIVETAERYLKKADRKENDYRPTNYFSTLSPDNLRRFYDDNPGLETVVQKLQALTGPDGESLGLGLNTKTLRAFGRFQMFQDAGYDLRSEAIFRPDVLGIDAMAVYAWISSQAPSISINLNPRNDIPAIRQSNPDLVILDLIPLLNMMRALALVDDYHMDPAFMLKSMQEFGPIDWRHPAAHALYWSAMGTERAEAWLRNKERVDFININRNIIHNLQKLAHQGKINFRPGVPTMGNFGRETINHSPDTRMIPAYDTAWQATMDKAAEGGFGDRHADGETFANGHENFLQAATYLYYYDGQETRARDYFNRAEALYGNSETSPSARDGEYGLSLADFARIRLDDDLGFQWEQLIIARIRLALEQGLAQRDQAVMKRMLDAARATYDEFQGNRETTRKADADVQGRQALPPFEDMVLEQFILTAASTQYSLPQKDRLWRLAGPLLNAVSDERPLVYEAYEQMLPYLQAQAQLEARPADIVSANFPKPRGYDQWLEQKTNNRPGLPGLPLAQ